MEENNKKRSIFSRIISYIIVFILGAFLMFVFMHGIGFINEEINQAKKLRLITDDILDNALKEIEFKDVEDAIYHGMFTSLDDKYSRYYNKEEMEVYNESTDGEYVGIGILSNIEEGIEVLKVFKESPAEKAGIKKGDKVIKVNDLSIEDNEAKALINEMLGEEGENVSIVILRGDKKIPYDIIREKVNVPFVESRKIEDYGYIIIYSFGTDVHKEFNDALNGLLRDGIKGLIVDLRDNPGGILVESVDIADRLLGEGLIVYTVDRHDYKKEYFSDEEELDIPVVFLANENSASASEILLGAIKDYKKGPIIGTKTFGKGIVQKVIELLDGTGYKMTTSQYFTPKGNVIHKKGVTPDIKIEYDGDISIDNFEKGNDLQLNEAIKVLKDGAYDN